jgi:DNA-binding Lrp family transcriptional regulator
VGEDRTDSAFAQTGPERRRYTVAEAAEELGLTAEAIRSRIKRGTLESVKEGATVYVLLRPDQAPPGHGSDTTQVAGQSLSQPDVLMSEMRDRIEDLRAQLEGERRANEENRRIIAALTNRIPELPPAQEGARERSREGSGEPPERTGRPSWWLVVALVAVVVLAFAALGYFGVVLFGG